MSQPTCKVRGLVQPGAMCGYIIVGAKHCGFSGDCQHKSCADMIETKVREMAEAQAALPAQGHDKGGE